MSGLPNVNIAVVNSNVDGFTPLDDRVIGLVLSGAAITDKIALSDPKLLTSFDDVATLGITLVNNALAYNEIKEFYSKAARGTKLYLMLYAPATTLKDMCDKDTTTGVIKLLNYANGAITSWGINCTREVGYTPVMSGGLDKDVIDAMDKAQALNAEFFAKHTPCTAFVPCKGFAIAAVDTVHDMLADTNNTVTPVLQAQDSTGRLGIGLALGRLAQLPVQRNLGRKKDGAMITSEPYWPDGSLWSTLKGKLALLHDKGYLIMRDFANSNGFYYNDDKTAVASTNDLNSQSRNCTINKAHRITYAVYAEEILDDIEVDAATGKMKPAILSDYQASIEKEINRQMADNISGAKAYINPDQTPTETVPLAIKLRVVPRRQNKAINVEIGFASTL